MKLRPNTRAVTLATLVMALGAAVYMNWSRAGAAGVRPGRYRRGRAGGRRV